MNIDHGDNSRGVADEGFSGLLALSAEVADASEVAGAAADGTATGAAGAGTGCDATGCEAAGACCAAGAAVCCANDGAASASIATPRIRRVVARNGDIFMLEPINE
jgi:hypothetical protein